MFSLLMLHLRTPRVMAVVALAVAVMAVVALAMAAMLAAVAARLTSLAVPIHPLQISILQRPSMMGRAPLLHRPAP